MGPMDPVLGRLDPLLHHGVLLSEDEFSALVDFVRHGLLDPGADPAKLRDLIPATLPSGRKALVFQ